MSSAGKAYKSPVPQRLFSMQNTSDDSVNATLSNSPLKKREPTTTVMMATNDSIRDDTDERSSNMQPATATTVAATAAKSTKRSSKTFFKRKDKSVPKRSSNHEVHGFISSFNQLTSNNNLPVITSATTTMLKQKHVTSNKCEHDNHGTIVDDSDDLSAEHNANKKFALDDRSKYSKSFSFLLSSTDKISFILHFACFFVAYRIQIECFPGGMKRVNVFFFSNFSHHQDEHIDALSQC